MLRGCFGFAQMLHRCFAQMLRGCFTQMLRGCITQMLHRIMGSNTHFHDFKCGSLKPIGDGLLAFEIEGLSVFPDRIKQRKV